MEVTTTLDGVGDWPNWMILCLPLFIENDIMKLLVFYKLIGLPLAIIYRRRTLEYLTLSCMYGCDIAGPDNINILI